MKDKAQSYPFDAEQIRSQFPIFNQEIHGKPLIYLDSAASAQKPQQVLDTLGDSYAKSYANVHRGLHTLSELSTDAYEAVRGKVASFINAVSEDEIVFTSGATMGLNLIAHSYGDSYLRTDDEILITVAEHHANIIPWHLLGKRVGARTCAAPICKDGSFDLELFKSHITKQTKIIAIPHVSNVLGTVFPVKEIANLAHENGAICVVDGCQGITHLPIDIQDLGCDFYVFSGHKLYGPSGIGICWGKQQIWADLPPFMGGGDMIDNVDTDSSSYALPPHRFEAGTPPIVETIGLGAAIDFVSSIGMDNLHQYETDILRYGHQRLAAVKGLAFIGEATDKSGVISFTLDQIHAHDIATLIDQEGIAIRAGHHCAQPLMKFFGLTSTARASIAVYSRPSDFDQLADALEKVNRIFNTAK